MSSSLTGYGIISFTVTQDRQVFMDHGDVKGLLLQAGVVQELRGFGYDGTAEVLEARFLQDTFYASVHIRLSLAHLGETIDQTDQTDQTDQHVLTWTNSNTVQYESTGWGSSLLLGTWSGTCDATLQRQP